jgi:hypothetical protein
MNSLQYCTAMRINCVAHERGCAGRVRCSIDDAAYARVCVVAPWAANEARAAPSGSRSQGALMLCARRPGLSWCCGSWHDKPLPCGCQKMMSMVAAKKLISLALMLVGVGIENTTQKSSSHGGRYTGSTCTRARSITHSAHSVIQWWSPTWALASQNRVFCSPDRCPAVTYKVQGPARAACRANHGGLRDGGGARWGGGGGAV